MGFVPLILVAALIVGLAVLVTRKREHQRQCPKCGAWCPKDVERCRTCGYSFLNPEALDP